MTTLTISGKEYKIKFGYNSFCDTDLLDRTSDIMSILQNKETVKDMEFTRKMFTVTRELLFVGFKKFNPVESIEAVGDLLDDYFDEGTKEDTHGLVDVFGIVAQELLAEGFFGDILTKSEKVIKTLTERAKKNQKKA